MKNRWRIDLRFWAAQDLPKLAGAVIFSTASTPLSMLSPASATLSSSSLLPSSFNMSMTRVSCHCNGYIGMVGRGSTIYTNPESNKKIMSTILDPQTQSNWVENELLSLSFWWCGELGTLEFSHKMEEHGQGNQWDAKLNEGYPSPWLTMARNVCIRLHMYHVYPCPLICIIIVSSIDIVTNKMSTKCIHIDMYKKKKCCTIYIDHLRQEVIKPNTGRWLCWWPKRVYNWGWG